MESTIISFVLSTAIILFFMRRYLKSMSHGASQTAKAPAQPAGASAPCPRCGNAVKAGAAFCDRCGIPLDLYRIKTAQTATSAEINGPQEGRLHPFIEAALCVGCGACVTACPEKGALEVVGGKAILVDAGKCLGHGDCVKACPTNGITLVRGNASRIIEVPHLNHQFETNVPGMFIIGELGGVPLIKNAINEGKLVIDTVRQQLCTPEAHSRAASAAAPAQFDVIIVGAGPAGLSAALSAHKYDLKYLVLERGEVASTIRNYPRHKFLMEEPVEVPLYGSLWVADSTKEALLDVWQNIIQNTGVQIKTNEKVEALRRETSHFVVTTSVGSYTGKKVVLAIGKHGTPRRIGVPGEDLPKVTYRLMEAEQYTDKKIIVVGGGDSAVEAALALSQQDGNQVALSYRKEQFSRLKERNQDKIDKAVKAGAIKALFKSEITEILPRAVLMRVNGQSATFENDFVVVCIGGEPPKDFLQKIGVEMVSKRL